MRQRVGLPNGGFVILMDIMPSMLDVNGHGDFAIAEAARASYQKGTKSVLDDSKLIDYLMRHDHTSPFEMAELKFMIRAPIFVLRQWHRHRTASINEESARYSEVQDEIFYPEEWRNQSLVNKQGSENALPEDQQTVASEMFHDSTKKALETYHSLLNMGVAREQARIVLPQGMMSTMVWKIDLHNLMRFLRLRMDPHAQQEIREYAEIIADMVSHYFPVTWNSFLNHKVNSVSLSGTEIEYLREILSTVIFTRDYVERRMDENPKLTGRQKTEFLQKLEKLILSSS